MYRSKSYPPKKHDVLESGVAFWAWGNEGKLDSE